MRLRPGEVIQTLDEAGQDDPQFLPSLQAVAILQGVQEAASRGPERLVVIAHSRGACDALAFALRDGPFVRDRVEAMFLVQGAFGGTGAADYVMGEGPAMDRRMPVRLRVLAYLLGSFEAIVMHGGDHGGLAGMTRAESARFWRRIRTEHADAFPLVGPKTFHVTSRVQPSRLRLFRRAIASYLGTYYGPNDGMVALGDQSLPGLGTSLGVLDAGHADLTHRFPATRAPSRVRRALVQSILMAVGGAGETSLHRSPVKGSTVALRTSTAHASIRRRSSFVCLANEDSSARPPGVCSHSRFGHKGVSHP